MSNNVIIHSGEFKRILKIKNIEAVCHVCKEEIIDPLELWLVPIAKTTGDIVIFTPLEYLECPHCGTGIMQIRMMMVDGEITPCL